MYICETEVYVFSCRELQRETKLLDGKKRQTVKEERKFSKLRSSASRTCPEIRRKTTSFTQPISYQAFWQQLIAPLDSCLFPWNTQECCLYEREGESESLSSWHWALYFVNFRRTESWKGEEKTLCKMIALTPACCYWDKESRHFEETENSSLLETLPFKCFCAIVKFCLLGLFSRSKFLQSIQTVCKFTLLRKLNSAIH